MHMDYKGVIIEESLEDKSVLDQVKIVDTKVEPITSRHKTPWLTQWMLHTFKITEYQVNSFLKLFIIYPFCRTEFCN